MPNGTLRIIAATQELAAPLSNAYVTVRDATGTQCAQAYTDLNGETPEFALDAPPLLFSYIPDCMPLPYSLYQVTVAPPGYAPETIKGVQIFSGVGSVLPVEFSSVGARNVETEIQLPPHGLRLPPAGEPEGPKQDDSRILTRVFIPETIRVHLGRPSNAARNVRVSFIDYIKNVASSEVYPTWPESALRANIHAQVGFTLNRIYTEWYPSRGYDFDITNSTAYDQFFVEGRNIFDNISQIVEEVFNVYPQREGQAQPLFSSYCNGTTATCAGLSQWGTVSLAAKQYTPLQMIQYYYGTDVTLKTTDLILGIEGSYPGSLLRLGSSGENVRIIQQQLNRIAQNYPSISQIYPADGFFGADTERAVKAFQKLFSLSEDGIVGPATWYQLSYIYAAVLRLSELDSSGIPEGPLTVPYPGKLLKVGSSGIYVRILQEYLSDLASIYPTISKLSIDGLFGRATENAVKAFQRQMNLSADGIVGPKTWNRLASVWSSYFAGE